MPTSSRLQDIIDMEKFPLKDEAYVTEKRTQFKKESMISFTDFLLPSVLDSLIEEANSLQHLQYCRRTEHTIFMKPTNKSLPDNHIFNRKVITSKGCTTTDHIPKDSFLQKLYHNQDFQQFIAKVVETDKIYAYKDPLSSITLHYNQDGQELGWHFDNSAFALTLLLQKPEAGGHFEYIPKIRKEEESTFGFVDDIEEECLDDLNEILDGNKDPERLEIEPGTLLLFKGRDSLHRVSTAYGNRQRILCVLAYNEVPNVSLPQETMKSFFGRVA